jgi:hypothetical protein
MIGSQGKRTRKLISEPSLPEKLSSSSEPTLERAVQERIGDHLRAMYDDLMQQPVPDRFAELLSRLETKGEKADQ